jgi:hypothetical protein
VRFVEDLWDDLAANPDAVPSHDWKKGMPVCTRDDRDRKRRMRARLVLLIIVSCILLSCINDDRRTKSPYPPGHFEEQIANLRQADVGQDAAKALAIGDRRFLLNIGWGGAIPGVPEWTAEMREKYSVRILDGTGDMVFGPKHKEFKQVANEYAAKYNQLILEHVSKREEQQNQKLEQTAK